MLDIETINIKMHELEILINHKFNDISNLADAMCAIKISDNNMGKNNTEYQNDCLALVGDSVLSTVLADKLYKVDKINKKGEITDKKKKLENNKLLKEIVNKEQIINYAYNEDYFYLESPKENKVTNNIHNQYIEAIIGAIYYDSGFEDAKKWILEYLFPIIIKNIDYF